MKAVKYGDLQVDKQDFPRLRQKMAKKRVRRLRRRGIPPTVIDRAELHRFLWERSDENHLIKVNMKKLSDALGCAPRTVGIVMAKFCEDGKALRVRTEGVIGVYEIADPKTWKLKDEETWANGPRKVIQWQ